ncbi:MAG: right-handed parallel beta-helix repeat-containing protein [Planctomycetota bacterium]
MNARLWVCAAVLVACPALASEASAAPAFVFNNNDAGPGSFRRAVRRASTNPSVNTIVFFAKDVRITSGTVVYRGSQTLNLLGFGAKVSARGSGKFDLFESRGGGSLNIHNLELVGAKERGVVITVPAWRRGTIRLCLWNSTVRGHDKFGVHIDDNAGSPAGVFTKFVKSSVRGNGIQAVIGTEFDDQDGVRVDERGPGGIQFIAYDSDFNRNKFDAIELDEGGTGDVVAWLVDCDINRNGDGSLPDINAEDPEEIDPEDGFDIDAAGGGDVEVVMIDCSVSNNDDEGIDLDQAGDGDCVLICHNVTVNGNVDEGIKISQGEDEAGEGEIEFEIRDSVVNSNGGDGIKLENFDDGDITADIRNCTVNRNDDGIELEQINEDGFEAVGSITLRLRDSDVNRNGDEGVAIAVFGDGERAVARVRDSNVRRNGGTGLKVEQDSEEPLGLLRVVDSTVTGNDEDIETENVTEVIVSTP